MLMNKIPLSTKEFALMLFALLTIGCKTHKGLERFEKALEIVYQLPIQDSKESMLRARQTLRLVERDSISIFIIPFFTHVMRNNIDKNGDLISEEWIRTDTSEYYVIYKENNSFGFVYDTSIHKVWRKIEVDSFLTSSSVLSLDSFASHMTDHDTLVSSVSSNDGSVLTEVYIPKIKNDFTYSDSTIIKYDKALNDFRFSFSRKEDEEKQRKLCQVKMVYNPDPQATTPELRHGRVISFEMNPVKMVRSAYIDSLVRKFESLSGAER